MRLYTQLGTLLAATSWQPKVAWRNLAQTHHPDKGGEFANLKHLQWPSGAPIQVQKVCVLVTMLEVWSLLWRWGPFFYRQWMVPKIIYNVLYKRQICITHNSEPHPNVLGCVEDTEDENL